MIIRFVDKSYVKMLIREHLHKQFKGLGKSTTVCKTKMLYMLIIMLASISWLLSRHISNEYRHISNKKKEVSIF